MATRRRRGGARRKRQTGYVGFKNLKVGSKVRNPNAVKAAIGRKKYGKAGMAKLAAQGRKKGTKNTHAARRARAARVKRR